MAFRLGVVLDASGTEDLAALAAHAERRSLDLAVVDATAAGDDESAGLDPWTAVVWIVGRTDHIPLAVATEPTDTDGRRDLSPRGIQGTREPRPARRSAPRRRCHVGHGRSAGANRGPRPAPDIAIWVGAYEPRMLELTGAVADGWLPTIEYLPHGLDSLPELNARIDDAAARAGRAPSDVRRLVNFMHVELTPVPRGPLNGPPEQWIDQLTELALVHGVSAFLVGGDDPTTTQRFASEVAPAVRDNVQRERTGRPTP